MKNKRVIISFVFLFAFSFVNLNTSNFAGNNAAESFFSPVGIAFAQDTGGSDGGGQGCGSCGGGDSGGGGGWSSGGGGDTGWSYTPPTFTTFTPPTPPAPPTCTNGATNFPLCNNNVCTNGATNFPACNVCPTNFVLTNGQCIYVPPTCTNGATNFPQCNNNVCTNGATNFPHCNNNVCINGATNFPFCNTCPVGQFLINGTCTTIVQTCTNGATNFPFCNNQCVQQQSQTQYLSCPSGQTGQIIQTRSHSCPGNVWGSWFTTSNTCQNIQQFCSNGATNFPACNNNVTWCNGVQYYAGYICPVINQFNLAVSTTGANPLSTTATINGYVNPYNNNATIWFDYGTSFSNLTFQTTRQNTSNSGAFNANLSGLTCGTRYFYRAVAQNNVETKYGSTLSFVTPNCYVAPVSYENWTITRLATKVGSKSAQLNGSFVNNGNNIGSCVSFFDYGTDFNLSQRTVGQRLYSNYATNYFSQGIFGLGSNMTYYYRAGVTCNGVTKFGQIYKFTTGSVYTYVAKKKVYNNVPKPVTIVTDNGKCDCDIPEFMNLSLSAMEGEATIGKVANYRVVFRNVSESALHNVVIRVLMPEELTVAGSDKGQFTKGGKTVTLAIPMLRPLEEGSMIVSTNVLSGLELGRKVVINADAAYTTPNLKKSGGVNKGEVTAYTISVAGNGTSMNPNNGNNNVSTGNSWMPQNFFEWVVFVLVFLIFLSALRYLFTAFSK